MKQVPFSCVMEQSCKNIMAPVVAVVYLHIDLRFSFYCYSRIESDSIDFEMPIFKLENSLFSKTVLFCAGSNKMKREGRANK